MSGLLDVADEVGTIRDVLRLAVTRFTEANLAHGHGFPTAFDEAVYLLCHALKLRADQLDTFLDARIPRQERLGVLQLLQRRITERVPAAYLTQEAWLAGIRFHVDRRVIVPRSYIAELLPDALSPWIRDPDAVACALDMCTGSGCLAILMALAYPEATVDAADVSADALAVARRNVAEHGLQDQVVPILSDAFSALSGRTYDLIISNPPYVTADSMARLPEEYRHEPALALAAGPEGLDFVHRLLRNAPAHLNPDGILLVEVGSNKAYVDNAYPMLALTWFEADDGSEAVFLVSRADLREAGLA